MSRINRCQYWCAVLAFSTAVSMPCVTVAADNQASNQARLEQLNKEIKELKAMLGKINSERSGAEQKLKQSEEEMDKLHNKIQKLEQRLKGGQQQLKKLQQRQEQLQQSRRNQQKLLAATLTNSYINGRDSWLKMLLNQQDPNQLARNLTYYNYLYSARSKEIKTYNNTLNDLDQVSQRITDTNNQLKQQQQELNTQQAELQQQRSERERALAKIKASLKRQDQQLAQKEAERKELGRVIATVSTFNLNIPEGQPFRLTRGKLPWPVQGKLLARYGSGAKNSLTSQGLLIGAPAGTPVHAIYNGQIVFANWLRGYGLVLIIDHGGGYLSLYAHNQTLLKSVGDWVQAGETIARVGDTGGQNRSALYFELRKKGQPYNPSSWLVAKK